MRNLHHGFDRYYKGQIYGGDCPNICGLLRIYELYLIEFCIIFYFLPFHQIVKFIFKFSPSLFVNALFLFSESRRLCFDLAWHILKSGISISLPFSLTVPMHFFYVFNGNVLTSASEGCSIFQNRTVTSQNKSKLFSWFQIVSASIDSVRLTLKSKVG